MKLRAFTVSLSIVAGALHASSAYADHHTKAVGSCQTIDQPGSYTLAKNIDATADKMSNSSPGVPACVVIRVSNVTLDLAGHTISGDGTGFGIITSQAVEGVTVRNGAVTNFGEDGVRLAGRHNVVEDLRAFRNGEIGIRVFANEPVPPAGNTVRNSVASLNGRGGIFLGAHGNSAVGNVANANGEFGIAVQCPGIIVNNVAHGNGTPPDVVNEIQTFFGVCTRVGNYPPP